REDLLVEREFHDHAPTYFALLLDAPDHVVEDVSGLRSGDRFVPPIDLHAPLTHTLRHVPTVPLLLSGHLRHELGIFTVDREGHAELVLQELSNRVLRRLLGNANNLLMRFAFEPTHELLPG